MANKGTLTPSDSGGYYRGDTFAPKHPVFDGLPSGGILDYTVFRKLITQVLRNQLTVIRNDDPANAPVKLNQSATSQPPRLADKTYAHGFGLNVKDTTYADPVAVILITQLSSPGTSFPGAPGSATRVPVIASSPTISREPPSAKQHHAGAGAGRQRRSTLR